MVATTTYSYDDDGNLTTRGDGPRRQYHATAYDADGNVLCDD